MTSSSSAAALELATASAAVDRLQTRLRFSRSAVIAADLDGYITDWAGAAERIFGYGASEILGRHLLDLFVDESDFELALGSGIDGDRGTVTVRHRRSDGVYVWVQFELVPEFDESGERVGLLAHAIDMQSNVAEIAQSRIRSRVFDLVPLPIAIADSDGTVVSANPAWLHCFGGAPEEVLGKVCPPLAKRRGTSDGDAVRNAVLRVTGQWSGTYIHVTGENRCLSMDTTVSAIVGDLGRTAGYFVLITAVNCRGGRGGSQASAVGLADH